MITNRQESLNRSLWGFRLFYCRLLIILFVFCLFCACLREPVTFESSYLRIVRYCFVDANEKKDCLKHSHSHKFHFEIKSSREKKSVSTCLRTSAAGLHMRGCAVCLYTHCEKWCSSEMVQFTVKKNKREKNKKKTARNKSYHFDTTKIHNTFIPFVKCCYFNIWCVCVCVRQLTPYERI